MEENLKIKHKVSTILQFMVYWSIVLVPFVASFSSAAVNILIGFMICAFILKKAINKDTKIVKTPLNQPFFFLIVVSLLSFVNSVDMRSSIQGITKLLKYGFLLIILAGEIRDNKHLKRIIIASLSGLLLASLDGIYQLIFGLDFFRHKPPDFIIGLARLKAAFPHTNIFAGYLALFVPLGIPLILYYLKSWRKYALDLITLLGLFCLVFTFCRSAAFGVWLALLFMGLIRKDKIIVSLVILALIIAPFLLPSNIKNWAKTTSSLGEFLLNKPRFVLYETSINMIKHHPFVGVGVNTYSINYQKYKIHDTSPETAGTNWYAHNSYLQMAGEIGFTGLIVFFWLLYVLFTTWLRFYRSRKDVLLQLCGLGIIMGLTAFLVHGLTETNLYYPKIAVLFWFQVGLLNSILQLEGF
jgi:O-antigen ligase